MSKDNGYWKALYESLAKRNDTLEEALRAQNNTIKTLMANLENAQAAVDINKAMLHSSLTEFNRKEQEYIGVINALKGKLRELGYADLDRLGQ